MGNCLSRIREWGGRRFPGLGRMRWMSPVYRFSSQAFWLVLSSTIISSCATYLPQPEMPLQTVSDVQLVSRLSQREEAIHTLKGLFRANLRGEGMPVSIRLDGVFFYRRPHTIRLKGFTRFGGLVFDFQLHDGHYTVVIPGEGRRLSGHLEDLSRQQGLVVPIRLSVRAIEAILGKVIKEGELQTGFVEDGDLYRFDIVPTELPVSARTSVSTQRIWIDRRHLLVNRMEYLTPDGEKTMTIQMTDFRRVKDASPVESSTITLPFHIEAQDKVNQGEVSLVFQELVANTPLDPGVFGLAPIEHVNVE